MSEFIINEFIDGYLDGRDMDSPWPSSNRSDEYRHSFDVGRREKIGSHLTADQARARANALIPKESYDAEI